MTPKEKKDEYQRVESEKYAKTRAQITDISHGCPGCPDDDSLSLALEFHPKWVEFGYDPSNHSLDIYFRKSKWEWDNGVAIQVNKLTNDDKEALRKYLADGK